MHIRTPEDQALLKQFDEELQEQGATLVNAWLPDTGWRLEVLRPGVGQIAAVEHKQLKAAKDALLLLLNASTDI